MSELHNSPPVRSRLSREQAKTLTTSRIMETARLHFLTRGFAETALTRVAEESGFSSGAIYSKYRGKDELFLAAFRGALGMPVSRYRRILDRTNAIEQAIPELREAFIDQVADADWSALRAQFEMASLNSDYLQQHFVSVQQSDVRSVLELACKAGGVCDGISGELVEGLLLASQCFMLGLAIKQLLLPSAFPVQKVRSMAALFFDGFLVTSVQRELARV